MVYGSNSFIAADSARSEAVLATEKVYDGPHGLAFSSSSPDYGGLPSQRSKVELASASHPIDILHVLGSAQPEGTGIAKIVETLAMNLDPARYRIHACFLGNEGPLADRLQKVCATSSVVPWLGGARDPLGAARFASYLRSRPFRIVHQHHGGRAVSVVARLVRHAVIVVHLHARVLESAGTDLVTPRIFGADVVVANSRSAGSLVEHYRTEVVYAGVTPGSKLRARTVGQARVIGTAGRLVRLKGVAYLLQAFAQIAPEFPDASIEIAGSGPELPALQSESAALGVSGRVRFLGWVDDLQTIFRRWSVLAIPSLEESFGLAALEGMAAGLPVIASNVGGLPEVVGGAGILVPPGDPTALATALRRVLKSPALSADLGDAARERVLREFSPVTMAAAIGSIYESLLSDSRFSSG
jgi:glycosyltransferase involved in cell wall biosynthesis